MKLGLEVVDHIDNTVTGCVTVVMNREILVETPDLG